MTISPSQLWYMTRIQPILVPEQEAIKSYLVQNKRPLPSLSLYSYSKALQLLDAQYASVSTPKNLVDFLKVLDNSLQEEAHKTLLLSKLDELRAFLSETCALSTSLTVETRKDGEKLIHEFVISAKT